MSEVAQTLEGWYVYHDFRRIDWSAWKNASKDERKTALEELQAFLKESLAVEEKIEGSHGVFHILGHKADLLFMHLRPTLEEIGALELAFNKLRFSAFAKPSHSYVSVVELSNYVSTTNPTSPEADAYVQRRLKPVLPKTNHLCFYPMNKRRDASSNWYLLSMEERRQMMRSHGAIGRNYAGRIVQIISGSIGFDDWEWGVTLFSDDPLTFKKLIYEMRFDEVSAKYSDFGYFMVGNRLEAHGLDAFMQV